MMAKKHKTLDPTLLTHLMHDRKARIEVARQSHFMFFHIYFSHHVKYPTADFQRRLFSLTEDPKRQNAVIVAFRGSAKTTIMTLSYPLWAILGVQQCKFVLLIGQTQNQAQQMLMNLKREIESNSILRNDFGGLEQQTDEWGRESLVIKHYGARIMAASTETSIRGIRFGEHRPDLIICDDVEDLQSVKTKEGRDKIYNWLMGDIIPAGNPGLTRLIVIGNLLHEDSLLMRLKAHIERGKFAGIFLQFPLLDIRGRPLWPGRYPNKKSIELLHKTVPSTVAWEREYMLKLVRSEDQVIHHSWIQYYNYLPDKKDERTKYRSTAIGVDLAISEKSTADYTAAVVAHVYEFQKNMRIFIAPHPLNKRMDFPRQCKELKQLWHHLEHPNMYIESVGIQRMSAEQLQREGVYNAQAVPINGLSKQERLAFTSPYIKDGIILFARHGCEELIAQLTGFGVEKHDDLADAFSLLIIKLIQDKWRPTESPAFLSQINDVDECDEDCDNMAHLHEWDRISINTRF